MIDRTNTRATARVYDSTYRMNLRAATVTGHSHGCHHVPSARLRPPPLPATYDHERPTPPLLITYCTRRQSMYIYNIAPAPMHGCGVRAHARRPCTPVPPIHTAAPVPHPQPTAPPSSCRGHLGGAISVEQVAADIGRDRPRSAAAITSRRHSHRRHWPRRVLVLRRRAA